MSESNNKNHFNDYDIFLAYLNDAEDRKITDDVLLSKQACKELSGLQKDMENVEKSIESYHIDDGYGDSLWNTIADQLDEPSKQNWLQRFFTVWLPPRFSVVGLSLMFLIAINFYFLGKHHRGTDYSPDSGIYQGALVQNVSLHLAQTDVFLTQISNMKRSQDVPLLANTAESLLASNRIYKHAYSHSENKRLQSLLSELEKVLIEVSNGHSPLNQNHLLNYTEDQLLFKVKSIRQQLASKSHSTMSI